MTNWVFTFYSPKDVNETCNMIKDVIKSINGKIRKERNNVIEAHWRSSKFITVTPTRFVFYVGKDMVRVLMLHSVSSALFSAAFDNGTPMITMERGVSGLERVWDEFIKGLCKKYPMIDFGLVPGKASLDAVRIVGDGIEQVFTSTSWNRPSWGGALLGGLLFGDTGAILGGMSGTTITRGSTTTRFSNEVLATVRYTNGLTFDGGMMKNSPTYNEIMVNMSRWNK